MSDSDEPSGGNEYHHNGPNLEVKAAHHAMDALIEDAQADTDGLTRSIGTLGLISIGVAAVVGAGIFVVTGHAAADNAGPAVILSFVVAGICAGLSALCYAELAGMIPVAGSTYSYAYVSMGTLVAWIIGWDLLVEYLFGAANVAVSWAGYLNNGLQSMGINIPNDYVTPAVEYSGQGGGIVNLPAMILIALVTLILYYGTKLSASATTAFVAVKLLTLLFFVVMGLTAINFENLTPFIPPSDGGQFGGWHGIVAGAAAVFYSYIAFDAVCTAAQEAKNPKKSVPRGVLGSLGIATVIYVVVGFVLVGVTSYSNLNTPNPLSTAMDNVQLDWVANIVDVGAIVGLAASVLALLFAQTRILMRMSEDGMLPAILHRVDAKRKTPYGSILVCGFFGMLMAGFLPNSLLTELISIGTLFAFVVVSFAVLILRRSRPDIPRSFKVPGGPVIPVLAILVSGYLMTQLPAETWMRLIAWLILGLLVYVFYSRSRAQKVIEERAIRSDRERADIAAGRDPHIPKPDPEAE